jgi:hypothetical protein
MFRRKKDDTWNHTPTVTARQTLEAQARNLHKNLRRERFAEKAAGVEKPEVTLTVLRDVRDRVGAIWYLRDLEQDARQAKRVAYVKKYRPVQTLDGLDPDPVRLAYRELANGFKVLAAALRAG